MVGGNLGYLVQVCALYGVMPGMEDLLYEVSPLQIARYLCRTSRNLLETSRELARGVEEINSRLSMVRGHVDGA